MQRPLLLAFLAVTLLQNLITGAPIPALLRAGEAPTEPETSALEQFARSVENGEADQVVGVYAPGLLALPVDQQPEGNAAYVTTKPDTATQFAMAQRYGSVGILAHNFLAGEDFAALLPQQSVVVVYGDGRTEYYVIREIQRYRALSPTSIFSNFINLDNTSETLTAGQLFRRVYAHEDRLVLQTCIEENGNLSWGRMFIIAEPAEPEVLSVLQQARLYLRSAIPAMAMR